MTTCPRCGKRRLDERERSDDNGVTMQIATCTSCDFYEIVDLVHGRPFDEQEFRVPIGDERLPTGFEGYVYVTPKDLVGAKIIVRAVGSDEPRYLKVARYTDERYALVGEDTRTFDACKIFAGMNAGRAYVARPWKEGMDVVPF